MGVSKLSAKVFSKVNYSFKRVFPDWEMNKTLMAPYTNGIPTFMTNHISLGQESLLKTTNL